MEKIQKQDITIVQEYDDNAPAAFLDREQIQQVFLNLLLNAVNAMPKGGVLTISIKRVKNTDKIMEKINPPPDPSFSMLNPFLSVSFKDTGSGIKEENLSRIFDPFFTTHPNGTGLGLSIAHKLLEKNNACIYIDSKEGQGTLATLILPAAHETENNPAGKVTLG
jgi:signal transduction histidine kinase